SPVRNEDAHLERVARSVAGQELAPARWIVVDDASTDDTPEILGRLASEIPFLQVVRTTEDHDAGSADRLARAAAPRGFNRGLAQVDRHEFTHVMKLDGDIELAPGYLSALMERFGADPLLGIAGGVLVEPTRAGTMRRVRIPRSHVHGALKCYTQGCFAAIGGIQERLGWDTIDETYARMRGYGTESFEDLVSIHHRPLGTADGALRGRARHGECAYISHYPLLWVTLRAFKVAVRYPPRGVSGVAFLYGYLRAAARRTEQVPDASLRRFARRELRRRLARALAPYRFTSSPGA
ncbi:MAG: glycosyltransferase family 2 protein, partial [Trebonia sp.]